MIFKTIFIYNSCLNLLLFSIYLKNFYVQYFWIFFKVTFLHDQPKDIIRLIMFTLLSYLITFYISIIYLLIIFFSLKIINVNQ